MGGSGNRVNSDNLGTNLFRIPVMDNSEKCDSIKRIVHNVLILNPGSSSLKFRLYSGKNILLDEIIEEIKGSFIPASNEILKRINKNSPEKISKVVYRIVHGQNMPSPMPLDEQVLKRIISLSPLAPLHSKAALEVINFFMKKINARHIACFDTSFHKTIPEFAGTYPLPSSLSKKANIKRYGFHGLSHQSMFKEVEKVSGKKYKRVISCQLGNGASICAIKDGKSIDTSMGFTPLEGLMMGTRSGSIDPAIISHICRKEKINVEKALLILQEESGLKGIAGTSNVRQILENEKNGDKKAKLALDMFSYIAKKYIGSYIAAMGGVDLIVLGGGISRSPKIRKRILSGLDELGISLKEVSNVSASVLKKSQTNSVLVKDSKNPCKNSSDSQYIPSKISSGKVEVWVLETDEQKYMFEATQHL